MRGQALVSAGVLIAVIGILTFRCLDAFAGAGHDDVFITLLAAENLAEGEGFVTANGESGEIGSSVLHVLLLACAELLGVSDLYLFNKVLGLSFSALALGLIVARSSLLFPRHPLALSFVACSFAALLPTFAFWTMGGLETSLVGLLVVWLAIELAGPSSSADWRSACASILLVLARPEGFIYLGTVLLSGLAMGRTGAFWRRNLVLPLGVFAAITAVRWIGIGFPFPLPVLAKAGGGDLAARIVDGLSYVYAFASASLFGTLALAAVCVRAIVLLVRARHGAPISARPGVITPAVASLNVLGAAAVAGGDWMAYYRFVAPAVPLLSVVLVQCAWEGLSKASSSLALHRLSGFAAMCSVVWLTREQSGLHPPFMHNTCLQTSISDLWDPAWGDSLAKRVRRLNHPYLRDEEQLLPFLEGPLKRVLSMRPELTVASHQMGYLPYHLKRLGMSRIRLVDTVGIVDPRLARVPGARGPLGIRAGVTAEIILDPVSKSPIARAIQARKPDLFYTLHARPDTIEQLAVWGWMLVWSRPEAKVFARAELVRRNSKP